MPSPPEAIVQPALAENNTEQRNDAKAQRSNPLPQKRNPLRRMMGKLWPLGRHKKSSDSIRTSERSRYSDRE
jgi:hypothetical protein